MKRIYIKEEVPRSLPRIRVETKGEVYFAVQHQHCTEPLCAYAYLINPLHRDPASGAVLIADEAVSASGLMREYSSEEFPEIEEATREQAKTVEVVLTK